MTDRTLTSSDIRDRILVETEHLIAWNKPAGLPLLADRTGAAALWPLIKSALGSRREPVRLAHRLDKGTSGVLILAKTAAAHAVLARAFAERRVHKHYVARCHGKWQSRGSLVVDLPLCRGRKSRIRIAGERSHIVVEERRAWLNGPARDAALGAQTWVRALPAGALGPANSSSTDLAVMPLTGRQHQIRVHLGWLGHPITGDHLYGRAPVAANDRLWLHCHRMIIPDGADPGAGGTLSICAPWPGPPATDSSPEPMP